MSKSPPSTISKELLERLAVEVPGLNGSAVPPKLQKAVDYALQELAKCAKPATRRSPAEPANPVLFLVEKLREFAKADRDVVSSEELAAIKKRRGRRGGRRGSVVCSSRTNVKPKGWKPTPVEKSAAIRMELKEMVSKSILLHGANEFTIDTVVDCMFERQFEPQAVIIKEGDPGDNLYLCTSGWIQVYKFFKNESKEGDKNASPENEGQDTLVARLEKGATFGELALMYDAPRSATCKAGDDGCTCWAIDRVTFQEVVKNAVQSRRKLYKEALASVPILAPLTDYERAKLADCIEEEKFQIDDVILQEGESGSHFYIVLEGEVRVNKIGFDKEVCERLGKGAFFGEIALIMNVPRTATVTATSLSRTARIHRDVFERMLGKLGDILSRHMELYSKYEEQ
jgi:cAMP-dependent protein kinase regulator